MESPESSWKSYAQKPFDCSYYQSDQDTTWVFKKDLGMQKTSLGLEPLEDVIHILQYAGPPKCSVILCSEEVKEEFKELLRASYPKTRRMAIDANRSFVTSYTTRDQLYLQIRDLLIREPLNRIIFLFEEDRVYRLFVQRVTRVKLNRICPCCHDRGSVGPRDSAAQEPLSTLSQHKINCDCCNKGKIVVDFWSPANYLRKI